MTEKKIALFAGTTEGRLLAERLAGTFVPADVFAATEYGKEELPAASNLRVFAGRLDRAAMEELFQKEQYAAVLDATHPYAALVSENIRAAGDSCGIPVLRVLRDGTADRTGTGFKDAAGENGRTEPVTVESVEKAVEFLKGTDGNVLVTTGSKELSGFLSLPDWENRVYARVLSLPEVVKSCADMGFYGKHLIAMQGPFSEELNTAMLKSVDAKWMVTKESGKAGGFKEKTEAAKKAGAGLVVIGRPKEDGIPLNEAFLWLEREFGTAAENDRSAPAPEIRKICLIGTGPGNTSLLTGEAAEAFSSCQLICGAKRCVEQLSSFGKPVFSEYQPEKILEFLEKHPEYKDVCVALSGDTGFYSGAGKLLETFKACPDTKVRVLPGISSVSYFFSKLGRSWDGVRLCSMHGRELDAAGELKKYGRLFFLAGQEDIFKALAEQLHAAGLSGVRLTAGENLSLKSERIYSGTAEELENEKAASLTVILAEWDGFSKKEKQVLTHGLADGEFLRGDVPMTKMEVRTVSVAKLGLREDDVVYDVGAGTGSVSIECARLSERIRVFAIERNEKAVELLYENKKKFGVSNMEIVEGKAPDCLDALPAPTHVFIGGSGGRMRDVVLTVLKKNPSARFVVNMITPESLAAVMEISKDLPVGEFELTSLTAARSRAVGSSHLMTGQNPVWIASFCGNGAEMETEWEKRI